MNVSVNATTMPWSWAASGQKSNFQFGAGDLQVAVSGSAAAAVPGPPIFCLGTFPWR
jgi:hypothetical protein